MAELIILRLEGALQSWGDASAWDNRGTDIFPSKSGIVGLIACAAGLPRESPEIYDLMRSVTIGIRADRAGQIACDFHTVQGMPNILNAAGKGKGKNGNTIVSHRWYLQDASFLVVLEVQKKWRDPILAALQSPRWPVYLGRKSCVPSRPVLEGRAEQYGTIMEALQHYPAAERSDELLPYELEAESKGDSCLTRADLLSGDRIFERRKVWRGSIRRDTLCT